MKTILTSFLLFASLATFAQTVLTVKPATAKLLYNGSTVRNPSKARLDIPNMVYIARQDGYITQGITAEELKEQRVQDYVFNLEKNQALPADYKSKVIYVAGFIDRTSSIGGYYTSADKIMNDAAYLNKLNEALTRFGYKSVVKSTVFEEKTENADFKLAGEIMGYSRDTRGSGFQISLVIKWSLFDINADKVVLETILGGFVDTPEDNITRAVQDGIRDSFDGLLNTNDFQEKVSSTTKSVAKGDTTAIKLPRVKAVKPESSGALSKASLGSVVTIKTGGGHGSGFIITADGYILTNAHVTRGSDKVVVIMNNGFEFDAEVLRENKNRDVALIKIKGKGFIPLPLKIESEDVTAGTEVIAIGTPESQELNQSVTKGIISGKRTFEKLAYYQTDVAVNAGNSGGPVINIETGEVVAIVVGKIMAVGVEGINFAIPIEDALKKLNITIE